MGSGAAREFEVAAGLGDGVNQEESDEVEWDPCEEWGEMGTSQVVSAFLESEDPRNDRPDGTGPGEAMRVEGWGRAGESSG